MKIRQVCRIVGTLNIIRLPFVSVLSCVLFIISTIENLVENFLLCTFAGRFLWQMIWQPWWQHTLTKTYFTFETFSPIYFYFHFSFSTLTIQKKKRDKKYQKNLTKFFLFGQNKNDANTHSQKKTKLRYKWGQKWTCTNLRTSKIKKHYKLPCKLQHNNNKLETS